jgi:sarcosine oxidase subunit gamma
MVEAALFARRRAALAQAQHARAGVAIRTLPGESRFSLRLPMSAAAVDEIAGFQLGMPINRGAQTGERWSARLGPNEWLIGGPKIGAAAIAAQVEAALAGQVHALVDVSHRNVAIEVAGAEAATVLNAGCPLDLAIVAFPAGSATRTLLGKAEIVLIRAGEAPVFRVECWRSFATYVHGFLVEAARDCPPLGSSG